VQQNRILEDQFDKLKTATSFVSKDMLVNHMRSINALKHAVEVELPKIISAQHSREDLQFEER